jgi:hypothetical protein
MLVVPVALVLPGIVRPAVPVTGEVPAHGVSVLVTPGTGMSGLTPVLPSSVAPSGMTPPLRVVRPGFPGVESGDAVPAAVLPVGTDTQPVFDPDPVRDNEGVPAGTGTPPDNPALPPPSNVEFNDGVPIPLSPAGPVVAVIPIAGPVPKTLAKQFVPLVTGATGAGLRPPLLSSVAPSGIPVGPTVAPMPSGDVTIAGAPGVLMGACAKPALQPNRIAIVDTNTSRMGASVNNHVQRRTQSAYSLIASTPPRRHSPWRTQHATVMIGKMNPRSDARH